jgi:3-oxoacyl-[acyl-carrier-protein] synthase-3
MLNTVITGTGSYMPTIRKVNEEFVDNEFYTESGERFDNPGEEIIRKFQAITGIEERRYADPKLTTSDIASEAAQGAIRDAGIDMEELDYIMVGHNFGDVRYGERQSAQIPSLAARVKYRLGIENPHCVGFDVLFSCPGWLECLIIADNFIKSGKAKKIMVIGAETLSRVIDQHDRDSMIYADGAGATILEAKEENSRRGVLGTAEMTSTHDEAYYLDMGPSYHPDENHRNIYIKMKGRKIYNYALSNVPQAIRECLEETKVGIEDVKKIFMHQANAKMDHAIIDRLYKLYEVEEPDNIMPMSIHKMGNSSVATIPTLYDWVRKGKQQEHKLHKDDVILFASVGAGMNINAVVYKE